MFYLSISSLTSEHTNDINDIDCERFFKQENKLSFFVKLKWFLDKFDDLKEKPYMITPCNHIFHTSCLKEWYEQKQDCPLCRLALPILEEE